MSRQGYKQPWSSYADSILYFGSYFLLCEYKMFMFIFCEVQTHTCTKMLHHMPAFPLSHAYTGIFAYSFTQHKNKVDLALQALSTLMKIHLLT